MKIYNDSIQALANKGLLFLAVLLVAGLAGATNSPKAAENASKQAKITDSASASSAASRAHVSGLSQRAPQPAVVDSRSGVSRVMSKQVLQKLGGGGASKHDPFLLQ